jgi:hypothetical protein
LIKKIYGLLIGIFNILVGLFLMAIEGDDTHQELDYAQLLEPKLRKVFYETYDEVPEQYSKVFKVHTSKKARETDYGLGAMTPWNSFGSTQGTYGTHAGAIGQQMPSIEWEVIPPGLERVYVHEEFAKGFIVERKFIDDEQYNVIEKMTKDLARAGRYKVEQDAADLFNNGFTTPGYDGKPLFADDHPLLGGGTGSNLIDGELSEANLKRASTLMRKQVDEAGKLIQLQPDTLIVPPELEWLAYELIRSDQKPGTNHNDINTMRGRYKIVVWDFLTSETAWFLADSKRHELNFFWRVKPEFGKEKDFDTLVTKWRGYMRYSLGYSDYRGIVGSTGVVGSTDVGGSTGA